ncbi:MAG: F-type H+-transporting ATPase subunit a [Parcubacteria group bacterium Gr01-1014_56]|nr:MAG: F-type H+-transporting ATPase subunit a [Parcubacteria group bacterium Gr01-1014_56]
MESGLHISLAAERVGSLFGLPITNTVVTSWLVIVFLLLGAIIVGGRLKLLPGKIQNAVEMLFEYLFGHVEQTLGSEKLAKRYFPLIATIFVFILTANMLDFLPIFGTFTLVEGGEHVPLFHAVSTDLNTTLALAIISFVAIELSGIFTLGVLKYGSKFVNVHGGAMGFIVGLLELIGNLARLVSFSFRLFGAIFAGEVLLMVIGSFVPLLLPVPLMAFEMFIGLLQAGIFAILTLAFIKIAIAEPHTSTSSAQVAAH